MDCFKSDPVQDLLNVYPISLIIYNLKQYQSLSDGDLMNYSENNLIICMI